MEQVVGPAHVLGLHVDNVIEDLGFFLHGLEKFFKVTRWYPDFLVPKGFAFSQAREFDNVAAHAFTLKETKLRLK